MKFKCDQKTLYKGLSIVSKAVSNRTTMPVLKGILIEVKKEGILRLVASDMDITITQSLTAIDCEEGSIVVPAKNFIDFVKKLPNGMVTVDETSTGINISCQRSSFDINGMNPEEFPNIDMDADNSTSVIIDKEILREMIGRTYFAASTDTSKGIITGILLELMENQMNLVAIDGYRMAIARNFTPNKEEKQIVIDAKLFTEISKIMAEKGDEIEEVELFVKPQNVIFSIGSTKVFVRLLEGKFTPYQRIIDSSRTSIDVVVNKKDLLESIDRASLLSTDGKNNLVRLNIKDGEMEILSDSEEGKIQESISVEKTGQDIRIGFNVRFLMEMVKAIEDERFLMKLESPESACIIEPLEGNEYLYLILPVRITS